jgi:hypothetical protein
MGAKILRELSLVLNANMLRFRVDVAGVCGDCFLRPTLAGRFFRTCDATDVSKVPSSVFVDRVSLIDGVVEIATVRRHAFAGTIHCLFWLSKHYHDIVQEYLTALVRSANSMQERFAAMTREDLSLPPSTREEWASAALKFRNDPSDLLRECEAYWGSPYFPYSRRDYERFLTDSPQHSTYSYCEMRAFRAHFETIGLLRRIVQRVRCTVLYGCPDAWRFGV